jgi:hypothetical protein
MRVPNSAELSLRTGHFTEKASAQMQRRKAPQYLEAIKIACKNDCIEESRISVRERQ